MTPAPQGPAFLPYPRRARPARAAEAWKKAPHARSPYTRKSAAPKEGGAVFCAAQCVKRKVKRNTAARMAVTGLISLTLPVQSLMIVYEMKPAAMP